MITKEQIEEWIESVSNGDSDDVIAHGDFNLSEILHLALAGLAVQRRPIDEAPRDGSAILLQDEFTNVGTVCKWSHNEWIVVWDHEPYNISGKAWFIPLSALGKPEV